MISFDLVNDLHVDTYHVNYRLPASDKTILVVAGDVSNRFSRTCEFLEHARTVYETVLFVDGNHEWYGWQSEMNKSYSQLARMVQKTGAHFLHKNPYIVGDCAFIGANGWYDLAVNNNIQASEQALRHQMGDYSNIWQWQKLTTPQQQAYQQSFVLSTQLQRINARSDIQKCVVVTHTVPRKDLIAAHRNPNSALTGCFVNTQLHNILQNDSNKKVKVWCFGHTHDQSDCVRDNIRYVNNCRGYPKEKTVWHPKEITV